MVLYLYLSSFAQWGINPQNMRKIWLGLWAVITGFICPGRTLNRGRKSASVLTTSNRSYTSFTSLTENPYAPHMEALYQTSRKNCVTALVFRIIFLTKDNCRDTMY